MLSQAIAWLYRRIVKALRKLSVNQMFTVDQFHHFVESRPALLFPAFKMQHHLRRRVLGVWFWESAAKRRIRLTKNGRFVSMESLLKMVSIAFHEL